MTTIAANRFEMAADTRCTDGSHHFKVKKIARIGDWIVGECGLAATAAHLIEHLKSLATMNIDALDALRALAEMEEDKRMVETEDVGLILLSSGGIYTYDGYGMAYKVDEQFYAIGSGSRYALGAWETAKKYKKKITPADCVRISAKLDINTALPIQTIKLMG